MAFTELLSVSADLNKMNVRFNQDDILQGWAPRPAGNPPRGEGGVPRPAPHCGEGGVPHPDPPRKNDQNRGEVAGQNKGLYLNFLQKRKLMMEQYHNTEHE